MESLSPGEYEIAQFAIPRCAFAAINAAAIESLAFAEGVARPRIEANSRNAGGNKIRLTCRVVMARRVIEAIAAATSLAERRQDSVLVADLSMALSSALKGCDEAMHPRHLDLGESGYLGRG